MSTLGTQSFSRPDLGLRVAALKMQTGQRLSSSELKRVAQRQWVDQERMRRAQIDNANSFDAWRNKNPGLPRPGEYGIDATRLSNSISRANNSNVADASFASLFGENSPMAAMTASRAQASTEGNMRARFGTEDFGQAYNRRKAAADLESDRLANLNAKSNLEHNRQLRPLQVKNAELRNARIQQDMNINEENAEHNRQLRPLQVKNAELRNASIQQDMNINEENAEHNRQMRPLQVKNAELRNASIQQGMNINAENAEHNRQLRPLQIREAEARANSANINASRLEQSVADERSGRNALMDVRREEDEISSTPFYLRSNETRNANPLENGISDAAERGDWGAYDALTKERALRESKIMKDAYLSQKIQASKQKFSEQERQDIADGIVARAYRNGNMTNEDFERLLTVSPERALEYAQNNNIRTFEYTDSDGKKRKVNLIGNKLVRENPASSANPYNPEIFNPNTQTANPQLPPQNGPAKNGPATVNPRKVYSSKYGQ